MYGFFMRKISMLMLPETEKENPRTDQTGRHTVGQTDIQSDKQNTVDQTDIQSNKQTYSRTNRHTVGQTDIQSDKQIETQTDR